MYLPLLIWYWMSQFMGSYPGAFFALFFKIKIMGTPTSLCLIINAYKCTVVVVVLRLV